MRGLTIAAALLASSAQVAWAQAPAPRSTPALLDHAIALDRAASLVQAEAAYLAAAAAQDFPELRFTAAARAASLALDRGDAEAARAAVALARAALPDDAGPFVLQAQVALRLRDPAAAQAAARSALVRDPEDAGALCVLARAHLAEGNAGVAKLLAARAAKADPDDAEPLLLQAEIARGAGDPAAELDPHAPAIRLALGTVLAAQGQKAQAEEQLLLAAKRAPGWPEPHLELARVKELEGDAKTALAEAKVFLRLSVKAPPAGHPIRALVQRCEEALRTRAQASVVQ